MKIIAQSLVVPKLPYLHLAYVSAMTEYTTKTNFNGSFFIVALITLIIGIRVTFSKIRKEPVALRYITGISLIVLSLLVIILNFERKTGYKDPDGITRYDMDTIENFILVDLRLGETVPVTFYSLQEQWNICSQLMGGCTIHERGGTINDGWLNPMKLKKRVIGETTEYIIISAGKDGRFYTGDDVKRTVSSVIEQTARERVHSHLLNTGFDSNPEQLALLAFKQEKMVEVWGKSGNRWNKVKTYPFTATSGNPGPKLREGDKQIPEGLYRITFLNPNSKYHLSLKISYPNTFDKKMAQKEGRTNLGGDIFFHGKAATVGCIPVGDKAIEELFLLVQDVGMEHVQVIIAPVDFRNGGEKPEIPGIKWDKLLYEKIEQALEPFMA